jgi:hypothetical protein
MALKELLRSEIEIDAALLEPLLVALDDAAGAELLLLLLLLLHAEMRRAAAAAPATAATPALVLTEYNDVPRLFSRDVPWLARARPNVVSPGQKRLGTFYR